MYTPTILWAGIAKERVQFAFFGGRSTTSYNIKWQRPGKAQMADQRAAQAKGRTYFTILERPIPDTVYTFQVQAKQTSGDRATLSAWRVIRFRTPPPPPPPSMADKLRATAKPNRFSGKVDARLQLKPNPVGKLILTKTTK